MRSVETTGTVQDGTLTIHNRNEFSHRVGRLRGTVVVSVEPVGSRRSNEANSYLWGVVYPLIGEHTGYSSEEVHEIFKQKFIEREYFLTNKDGEIVEAVKAPGTTRTMSKSVFWEYVDKVILFASCELGVEIPQPDKNYKDNRNA
jgi:hypothetical protein